MDLDSKVGGDSVEDHILLVTDAAVGDGSAINLEDGTATPGVSLALEGRTLADAAELVRWDYLLTPEYAQALTGMLLEQLTPEAQAHLIAVWRRHGVAGL